VQNIASRLIETLARHGGMFSSYFSSWRWQFDRWQAAGVHLMPVHYYSPIPDTRTLGPEVWAVRSELPGVDLNETGGLKLLRSTLAKYAPELADVPREEGKPGQYYFNNPAFRSVDATVLYSLVRDGKPKRIVEIGNGYSSLVIDLALSRNEAGATDYVSIDPYPPKYLDHMTNKPRMIAKPVQEVPLSVFEGLEAGDILFIDSTHVARIGSDVVYEYLEILPRLSPGVLVHIHDIFLPGEYPETWIKESRFFWNEQYLLQAFLTFNDRFRVTWPGHCMHLRHGPAMAAVISNYSSAASPVESPASFWIVRV